MNHVSQDEEYTIIIVSPNCEFQQFSSTSTNKLNFTQVLLALIMTRPRQTVSDLTIYTDNFFFILV